MTRRFWILAAVLGLAVAAFAAPADVQLPIAKRASIVSVAPQPHGPGRYLDETIYFEDWEDGDLAGWTPIDLTAQPATWHINDWNAFGGAGMSWWVGDSTVGPNGGYLDDWYMALDSPPITLPALNPALRFYHRYSCEDPGGEPAGYNGWDGMNLRISTNNGTSWTVVPSTALTPAYDRSSLYSFGFQHGEGTNIPGWCGVNNGRNWHIQTANLAQWAGQTVKLRWAFASDPAYSTPQNATMFGWQVDAIRVYSTGATDTVFTTDANAIDNFTTLNVQPTGGNLWRVATDNTSPAGPHIIVCNNANNNLYNPNMNNVLESPLIDARNYGNGTLMADVQVTGVVMCETGFPDCDYWGMEVSIDSGQSWCAISNPTCDPEGTNYVYSDCPEFWASFDSSYSTPMDFSALLGNVIKFRFTFQSKDDNLLAVGPKFDGFIMEYSAGFPNDITCYTLQVRYPNQVNRPVAVKAYFENVGQNALNDVQTWWRRNPGMSAWAPFYGRLSLDPGEEARKDTLITITQTGLYSFVARSGLTGDENMQNDTAYAPNVEVQAASQALEIGYDNRSIQYRFDYNTGMGPLVHFTPVADGVVEAYDLTTLRLQFDQQTGSFPIGVHVYAGGASPGAELWTQDVTVNQNETAPAWKVIDVSGDPDLQGRTDDFWLWLEVVGTDPNENWPQILGDDSEPWDDVHFYTWDGAGTPTASDYFYQIHAVLDEAGAVREIPAELPTAWSLEQNYPNPFNPTTEIRYSVPRSEHVTLKVFNMMGQEVATLVNQTMQPGVYAVSFDGVNLASGVYLYRLESASFTATHKMLLMK